MYIRVLPRVGKSAPRPTAAGYLSCETKLSLIQEISTSFFALSAFCADLILWLHRNVLLHIFRFAEDVKHLAPEL